MRIQGCLKKASTNNNNDRKGEASCLGTSKLLLVDGELDVIVGASGGLLLLGSNVYCSGRSGKTKREKSKGENLAYPRVCHTLLSNYAFVSNGMGRLYIVD